MRDEEVTPLAVCSTHLVAARDDGAVRRQQGARVAQVAAGYVRRGFPTFVGGDFNDTPTADTLDPLYRRAYGGGARGVFTESNGCCGRSGTPTLGTAKFDYGFASAKWRVVRSWVRRRVVERPRPALDGPAPPLTTTVVRRAAGQPVGPNCSTRTTSLRTPVSASRRTAYDAKPGEPHT